MDMDITEIRRRNLGHLIETRWRGKRVTLALAMKRSKNFISRYFLGTDNRINISTPVARRIEELTRSAACPDPWEDMPANWLDSIANVRDAFTVPLLCMGGAAAVLMERSTALPHHGPMLFVPVGIRTDSSFAVQLGSDVMQDARSPAAIPQGYYVVIDTDRHCRSGDIICTVLHGQYVAIVRLLVIEGDSWYLRTLSDHYEQIKVIGVRQATLSAPVVLAVRGFGTDIIQASSLAV